MRTARKALERGREGGDGEGWMGRRGSRPGDGDHCSPGASAGPAAGDVIFVFRFWIRRPCSLLGLETASWSTCGHRGGGERVVGGAERCSTMWYKCTSPTPRANSHVARLEAPALCSLSKFNLSSSIPSTSSSVLYKTRRQHKMLYSLVCHECNSARTRIPDCGF